MDELILVTWKDHLYVSIDYPCGLDAKKTISISSLQRREKKDSIFESTVEIKAKLKLKSSRGKEEMASVKIPAQVVVNSLKVIKNRQTCAEEKNTADDVLEKLKHENLALKNHIITNGLALPSELD